MTAAICKHEKHEHECRICEQERSKRSQVECGIIKPCPFCGGEAELVRFDDELDDHILRVACKDVNCCGAHVWEDLASEAIEMWNKRAS